MSVVAVAISLISLLISGILLWWTVIAELYKRKAELEVRQITDILLGGEDERPRINLFFRNLSPRSTAVLEVKMRGPKGTIRTIGADEGVEFPIKISPWDVHIAKFRVPKEEEDRMTEVRIRDLEDREIIIPKGTRKLWHSWNTQKPRKSRRRRATTLLVVREFGAKLREAVRRRSRGPRTEPEEGQRKGGA